MRTGERGHDGMLRPSVNGGQDLAESDFFVGVGSASSDE
jgi:hypothetical protein